MEMQKCQKKKAKKKLLRRKIDTPCESNINTAVEEHFSSENT